MTLPALRDDALTSAPDGLTVRLCLPWIRSLPLSSVDSLALVIDEQPVNAFTIALGDRSIPPADLSREQGWWFLQDRLVLQAPRMLPHGTHDVSVSFRLIIPYLQVGPEGPLALPFHVNRSLVLDAPTVRSISRDVT